jgi:uncharacterized membrane protein
MEDKELAAPGERQRYTVSEKANEEANKLFYDVFKHLTTLSTGSILILATLLETVFNEPQWLFLIVISLVSFILSIISAVRMMFFQASAVLVLKVETTRGEFVGFLITVGSFLLGIISFVVFAVRNFYG